MPLVDYLTKLLSVLTLLGSIFIVVFVLYFVVKRKRLKIKIIEENGLKLAFAVALFATLGSLFYSEIAGYAPCKLCWFQRVFMFPQVLLLGTALIRKAKYIFNYLVPLGIVGGSISIYHYIIQRTERMTSCSVEAVSCSSKYTFEFGFITIPIMTLVAFTLIIIFLYAWKKKR